MPPLIGLKTCQYSVGVFLSRCLVEGGMELHFLTVNVSESNLWPCGETTNPPITFLVYLRDLGNLKLAGFFWRCFFAASALEINN